MKRETSYYVILLYNIYKKITKFVTLDAIMKKQLVILYETIEAS